MIAGPDASLVCRLEAAAAAGWPATIQERSAQGWLLRATPGLTRLRSNHALPPCRPVDEAEIEAAVEAVAHFAAAHDLRPGVQVSPLPLHAKLDRVLGSCGWAPFSPALVLVGPVPVERPALGLSVHISDRADSDWLRTWERCDPDQDAAAHADTVFAHLAGRALFARLGTVAVGISVPALGVVGMFCLAVDSALRRQGLGRALVGVLLSEAGAQASCAYLQVEEENTAARRLYERLGFIEAYRYCHRRQV